MEKKFKTKINISCSAKSLWKTLTESEFIQQYMFGSSLECNWNVGDPILYFMMQDGKRIDMVSGVIERIEEGKILEHSLYPVGASYPPTDENHIHVLYRIEAIGENDCSLEIEQYGFENAAEGEKRYNDSKNGWDMVLPKLKAVAEAI